MCTFWLKTNSALSTLNARIQSRRFHVSQEIVFYIIYFTIVFSEQLQKEKYLRKKKGGTEIREKHRVCTQRAPRFSSIITEEQSRMEIKDGWWKKQRKWAKVNERKKREKKEESFLLARLIYDVETLKMFFIFRK